MMSPNRLWLALQGCVPGAEAPHNGRTHTPPLHAVLLAQLSATAGRPAAVNVTWVSR